MPYLNHAGTSWPKPHAVHAVVAQAQQATPDRWSTLFEASHHAIAASFGVPPESLLITPGCTSAIAVAMADVPLTPTHRVVTSGMEHHALTRPLHEWTRRGVSVVEVPRSGHGPFDVDAYQHILARGGVGLVAVSMASNVTGELLPWEDIVAIAHEHGARVLLDGAQVAGWWTDLGSLPVDLFAFAGHKGPQAPYGVGGLYVRPGLILETLGATCDGAVCRTGPGYCDTGSVNLPAMCGLAAGLQYMADHAPLASARSLETLLRTQLAAMPGVHVVGSGPRMPTCSVVVEGRASVDVAQALAAHDVWVRGGTQCAPATHRTLGTHEAGTVRFSVGPGTTADDIDATVHAMRAVLAG